MLEYEYDFRNDGEEKPCLIRLRNPAINQSKADRETITREIAKGRAHSEECS
jgi:hypothetical protein